MPNITQPLVFDYGNHKPTLNLIMHKVISDLANKFVSGCSESLTIGMVDNDEIWQEVKEARLRIYKKSNKRYQSLANENGEDSYDSNSYVFYARYKEKLIGSIRLNRYHFEVNKFVECSQLDGFLGPNWQEKYLEISRLSMEPIPEATNISNALIVYASLITACSTPYKYYLAYSHPRLRDMVFKFQQHEEMLTFKIPERRSINYVLFKGAFWQDFLSIINQHKEPFYSSLCREMSLAKDASDAV